MEQAEVLVLGAGMAGCSVAFHASPFASVTILEANPQPAMEGAAQNAGLIRRMDAEPCDRALAQRTHHFLNLHTKTLGIEHVSHRSGSVLALVRDPLWLHDARAHLVAAGARIDAVDADDFPALRGAPVSHAWHLPDEWVTDGPSLARALLAQATAQGAELKTSTQVLSLTIEGGRCVGVMTTSGPIRADITVLACGAWAGTLAASAELRRPLTPLRRMAAVIGPDTHAHPEHPWCWLDDVGLYARAQRGSWLVSPCDERPDQPQLGADSTGDPDDHQWRLLQNKIQRFLPALSATRPQRGWTGLRVFCPDRRPMLGADGECDGLFWAAGLGGSGVSSSIGVGEALADAIQNKNTPWLEQSAVSPSRSQLRRWPITPEGDPQRAELIDSPL